MTSSLDPIFDQAGREWNVDPDLLRAVAGQESRGNSRAVSRAGAQGLMQIIPETQRHLGVTDPFDPQQSIYAGAKYLSEGLDAEQGDPQRALLFYHGGSGWRDHYGPESAAYVPGVAAHYQAIQAAKKQDGGAAVPKAAQSPAPDAGPDDDEARGKALIEKLAAPAAAPAAAGPVAAPAAANDDDEARGRALIERMTAAPAGKAAPAAGPAASDAARGVARNTAAGVLEGAGGVLNFAANPSGALGNMLATGVVTAHDALAPVFGYQRFPDDVRNLLLGEQVQQPGSAAIDRAGRSLPGTQSAAPSDVPANTDTEQTVRKMAAGAVSGILLPAPVPSAMAANALGAGLGHVAGQAVPPWLAPGAETAANLVGAGGALHALNPLLAPGVAAKIAPPDPANRLSGGPRALVPADQTTAAPSPGMGAPRPQSGGAAASSAAEATMTPAEILANRHVAEKEWLNRTNTPGVADNRVLVDGVNPTLAQREQTVQTAREQKLLSGQSADVSQEERALADEHNLKRQDAYQKPDLAGSTVLLNNVKQVAKDKLDAGLNAAFANKTAADAQPVVAMADKELAGRSGKRAVIETEVKGVRARLFDADGKLETDPEILYGVREHINDILSKENQRQNPVSGRAQSVLIKMRDELDTVIDPAAPGFTAAIKGYAADMKQPDVMEALQERYNGLHDSQGRMQFSKVHSLMRDVVDARQPGAALSPFQHISDEQMAKLQNLHDDLKRVASSEDLARAKGSDTAQNMWDAAKAAVKGRGAALVGAVPVVGKAVQGAHEAYAPFAAVKAQRNALKRGMEMLHPDPKKYPTHNRLDDH